MKENEFIKKYGITEAKALVNEQSWTMRQMALSTTVDTKELTKLVESHELIESRGGLDAAKHELIALQKHLNNTFGWVTVITAEKIDRLKQAILDVESCQ